MDDGAVAGSEKAVARVITILSELGPQLGLFLNVSKCEVFFKGNMNSFPPGMKRSNTPNMEDMEVLGALPSGISCFVLNLLQISTPRQMFCSQGCSKLDPKTHRLLICCFASVVTSVKWSICTTILGC